LVLQAATSHCQAVLLTESRVIGGVLTRTVAGDYLVDVAPTGVSVMAFSARKLPPFCAKAMCSRSTLATLI
jgi:hypothetical protein